MFLSILRVLVRPLDILGKFLKRTRCRNSPSGRKLVDFLLLPSDVIKILRAHREKLGRYPRLLNPTRLSDCLQRSKLVNRNPVHTIWADKLSVREYVSDKIGPAHLTTLLWSGTDLATLDTSTLPDRFVIKANNGSGTNIIVHDKTDLDWDAVSRQATRWLKGDHSTYFGEWQYRWIEPRILIEEMLQTEDGKIPTDYKFYVFHGRVEMVTVTTGRFDDRRVNLRDRFFRHIDGGYKTYPTSSSLEKPACFDQMVEIAECLAGEEPFVRVDLYALSKPVFGELTLHPAAGAFVFRPDSLDQDLGDAYLRRKPLAV